MSRYLSLAFFLVLVVGGGSLIGIFNTPDEWYAALEKPFFNPPGWVFGPVWSALYIMIAIAGWRIWEREPAGAAMKTWWLQLVLNFAWSPVFFSLQSPGLALAIIVALLVAIIGFIRLSQPVDRTSSLLFVPYLAWVSFATLLNGSIAWLN